MPLLSPLRAIALTCLVTLSMPATASEQEGGAPPKLIVAISVDQFSADIFQEYRPYFEHGLKQLVGGAVFPRGYQSHAATETCPGHSTILTGSRPARTGIIANDWFDVNAARADKRIYCVEDESRPGTSSRDYVASPMHLRVPTLGTWMKRSDPRTRVVSVAGKDRAAILLGGHDADQLWWLNPEGYVSYKGVKAQPTVERVNAAMRATLGRAQPAWALPVQCHTKDLAVDLGANKTVGNGRFAREAEDFKAFRASPEQDAATLALATVMVADLRLGKGPQTDLLAVGLSATDYIGHTFGTEGTETCIQMAALDRELGRFFRTLDRAGIDYAVMLTADHGGHDLPERRVENAMPAQRVDPVLKAPALSQAIAARVGTTGRVLLGDAPFGDLYLDPALSAAMRARVEAETIAFLQVHPQVHAVLTRAEIAAHPLPAGAPEAWSLLDKARASYDPQRSGDLLFYLDTNVTPIVAPAEEYVTTHGSIWDSDRRVPILFWRRGMRGFQQPLGVETVDILPTLASLIGLDIPADQIDGRCLDIIAGPETSCR